MPGGVIGNTSASGAEDSWFEPKPGSYVETGSESEGDIKSNAMRKEIEVKAKLNNSDEVISKLKKLGCVLSEPLTQHDIIFVDDNYGIFDEFQPDKNLLRIRESNGKFILTLKQPKSNEQDAIEHETEVKDAIEAKEILEHMGLHEAVQVHKIRRKTNYNDWEICLDEVEGLGSFIEVEKITDSSDVEAVQNELFVFLQSLGVKKEDRVTSGYDTLVYRKNHQFEEGQNQD